MTWLQRCTRCGVVWIPRERAACSRCADVAAEHRAVVERLRTAEQKRGRKR